MTDPVLAWCDDIHSVRGNVSQLQATLNQIITKAPTVAQYKTLIATYDSPEADQTTEAPHILEKLRSIMHSPQVKVAVRLKSLYDRGYLPFLLGLSRINFRSQKSDRFVGYLLDYSPPKIDSSETFPEEGEFSQASNLDAENVAYPPSLPPIENQSLLMLVFTDKSLRQPSDFLESEFAEGFHDYNNNHNRKLMLRGKDILNLALTDILDEAFPRGHEDDLEFLKYRLTSTSILAKLAFCYSFSDTVMHQISKDASVDDKLIVFKNVFLAYIGGMSKSEYTYSAIRLWIGKLYAPLISKLQTDPYKTQLKSVFSLAYAELNFMFRRVNNLTEEPTKRIKYEFRMLSTEIPIVCQLFVGDSELGVGTGSTLEEAKQKASYTTFDTPELRSELMNILVHQFRTPVKEKETTEPKEAPVSTKEAASDDEAYSPGISGDEYEPEEPKSTNDQADTHQSSHVVPTINYSDWPPPVVHNKPQNGTDLHAGSLDHKRTQKSHNQSPKNAHQHPVAHPQVNFQPVAQPQARMPLPYGKLPPIPNMKKKGGKN
ncbi:hypothetical protein JCM33374_g2074 [Metschnikowia sp. JCM 33374]|nr:hypothetical protein JCM33374_g2074 [Metschnikowia sp. JCM 33374]